MLISQVEIFTKDQKSRTESRIHATTRNNNSITIIINYLMLLRDVGTHAHTQNTIKICRNLTQKKNKFENFVKIFKICNLICV